MQKKKVIVGLVMVLGLHSLYAMDEMENVRDIQINHAAGGESQPHSPSSTTSFEVNEALVNAGLNEHHGAGKCMPVPDHEALKKQLAEQALVTIQDNHGVGKCVAIKEYCGVASKLDTMIECHGQGKCVTVGTYKNFEQKRVSAQPSLTGVVVRYGAAATVGAGVTWAVMSGKIKLPFSLNK